MPDYRYRDEYGVIDFDREEWREREYKGLQQSIFDIPGLRVLFDEDELPRYAKEKKVLRPKGRKFRV